MSQEGDEAFMRRAIDLASAAAGTTAPNPPVGCVIVAGGRTVGEGATAAGGRPHAEERALDRAGELARGATAFVTLEPCGARSSGTVSCAERLIAAGVARVVYAAGNPHPLSAGQGPSRLRAASVVVEAGLLTIETSGLYAQTNEGGASPRRPGQS